MFLFEIIKKEEIDQGNRQYYCLGLYYSLFIFIWKEILRIVTFQNG